MSVEGWGKRPYKVWDSGRQVRKGLVASTFTEFVERGREKLDLGDARLRVVLEADGTQVDDPEYFNTLPENTVFLLLRQGEHWYPAGVEVLKQAITAIPRIVCETIYSLGLHDEAPVWKVMDQYGKITVVLSWDPCHHRGEAHKHGTSSPSPRKPSGTARVIVSGVGESTTSRNDLLTTQTSFGTTPSPIPGSKSPIPTVSATGLGTITTILRDGKKETLINDVSSSSLMGTSHPATVINHDTDLKAPFVVGAGTSNVVGKLSRQGSSVESTHSATVHIHTPECCALGHPTPTARTRVSPTGDQSECDFHCCALHEESARIQSSRHYTHQSQQQHSQSQVSKTVATSPIQEPQKRSGQFSQQTSQSPGKSPGAVTSSKKPLSHVRFLPEYRGGSSQNDKAAQRGDAESSESETENTTNDEENQLCEKFLLLTDQPSEQKPKKHLSIKDIGVILDRLSSKIIDVERLDREAKEDGFNWTIKATIKGDTLRELGVLYAGHFYTIEEHPDFRESREEDDEEEEEEEEATEGKPDEDPV